MTRQKILDRARDELFSHVNRCGVLHAATEDQEQWMGETIEYLGERFPDLTESDLQELYNVGIRFCQPAIPHGSQSASPPESTDEPQQEPAGETAEAVEAA